MSTLNVATIKSLTASPPVFQDSSGVEKGQLAKAWVNFNGSSVTSATDMTGVNNSFNVSSVVDNGAGKYTVNMSITMSSSSFCVVGGGSQSDTFNDNVMGFLPLTTTSFKCYSFNQTGNTNSGEDASFMSAAVFGD